MLKRFYIYLLLGIGIVLTIPNTVFAVASCDFNEVDENPITSSYASLTTKHTCNADDVMEINSNATMTVNPVVIKVGDSNNVSITNSGTISGGKKAINLKNGDNTILYECTALTKLSYRPFCCIATLFNFFILKIYLKIL